MMDESTENKPTVSVVMPCYCAGKSAVSVLNKIGPEVSKIFVVDDGCPENTGEIVLKSLQDRRLEVLFHESNQGVGAATVTGYAAALEHGSDIVVKIDSDGQMDPSLIPAIISPILSGKADYVKGNRFFYLANVKSMPLLRLVGNACLSFLTKLSTGYWQIFDPTNGFVAVHRSALSLLDLSKISKRYFFESDMLFHLNMIRAVVSELPMKSIYAGEVSNLRPIRVIVPFGVSHLRNLIKRLVYNYFVRGFSVASLELLMAPVLYAFGLYVGVQQWALSIQSGQVASAGEVMLAALPIILATQFILSWLHYDVSSEPRIPIQSVSARSTT